MLYGQNEPQWVDTLERLKTIPLKETLEKLELSYNSLENDYKEIFLDVACLLKGWKKDRAIIVLESCGFHARNGLRVLEQKSLITISQQKSTFGCLDLHDHIEEMGKNIVRRLKPNEPKRHSRLWIEEEIVDILANDSGTKATKCMRLIAEEFNSKILKKGLGNMKELRLLLVCMEGVSEPEVSNWNFDEVSLHLPNALRFLGWMGYPFSCLPKTFQAKNLVGLEMVFSNIVQLWKDGEQKVCLKLRFLWFTHSKLRTLDLSVTPNLERLILKDCDNLVEVHFHVTPNLKELRIRNCNKLEKLHMPAESPKLRSLDLSYLKLMTLHLGITPNLETLRLNCTDMVELRITECPKLVTLHIDENQNLKTLDFGLTPNLESLILKDGYWLEQISALAECLKKLIYLYIDHCGMFISFKFDKKIDSPEVVSLSELHLIAHDTIFWVPVNTWPVFRFSCYYKEDPASSFGNLERLFSLGFGADINADSFSDIICGLQSLRKLTLEGGIPEAPKNLDWLDCLEDLSLQSTHIKTLPDSICMLKHLKSLKLESCLLLKELPVDIGRLEYLESLILYECKLLKDLPNSICEMKRLKCLELTCCIKVEKLPEEIGLLECLKELNIKCTAISHLPRSIHGLKGLRIVGDRVLLKSTGSCLFKIWRTSDDEDEMFCYIHE